MEGFIRGTTETTKSQNTRRPRTLITFKQSQMDSFMPVLSKLVTTPLKPHVVGEVVYLVLPFSKGEVQKWTKLDENLLTGGY